MKTNHSILLILLLLFTSFRNKKIAREFVDTGFEKSQLGDYMGAIADYTNAIAINP